MQKLIWARAYSERGRRAVVLAYSCMFELALGGAAGAGLSAFVRKPECK